MDWIAQHIDWIMGISGALTLTMLYAFVAPNAALRANFGEEIEGPLAAIIVRNWGALIGLVGAMLVYGAFNAQHREPILVMAGASKIVFIGLVLSQGARYLKRQAGIAVIADTLMVGLFGAYLATT